MITRSPEFNVYKSKEFRGDVLLKFIAADLFIKKFPNFTTQSHIPKIDMFLRNKVLTKVALKLGIEPLAEDLAECRSTEYAVGNMKPYANAVEVHIYELFEYKGLEAVYAFIDEHLFTSEVIKSMEGHFKHEYSKERPQTSEATS